MTSILTRCGNRCDLCLAYRPNNEHEPAIRQKLSDGWFKYFGFRIEAEYIICDGCRSDLTKPIDQECPVRPCVIDKGLENCGACEQYPCDNFSERKVSYEEIKLKHGLDIPVDDYLCFIRPYENQRRLEVYKRTGKIVD